MSVLSMMLMMLMLWGFEMVTCSTLLTLWPMEKELMKAEV